MNLWLGFFNAIAGVFLCVYFFLIVEWMCVPGGGFILMAPCVVVMVGLMGEGMCARERVCMCVCV